MEKGFREEYAASPLRLRQLSSVPKLLYLPHQDQRFVNQAFPLSLGKSLRIYLRLLLRISPHPSTARLGFPPLHGTSSLRRVSVDAGVLTLSCFQLDFSAPHQWAFWATLPLLLLQMDSWRACPLWISTYRNINFHALAPGLFANLILHLPTSPLPW